jgi:hypothetical protein
MPAQRRRQSDGVKRVARFSRPSEAITRDRSTSGAEMRQRVGCEFAHSAIDDHSRLVSTELHRDEKVATVAAVTARAIAFFAGHGSRSSAGRPTTPGPTPTTTP